MPLNTDTNPKLQPGIYQIYCDGGFIRRTKCGISTCVIVANNRIYAKRRTWGRHASANYTELIAAVQGVQLLPPGSRGVVYTDSMFVLSIAKICYNSRSYFANWLKATPRRHLYLKPLEQLLIALRDRQVEWFWIPRNTHMLSTWCDHCSRRTNATQSQKVWNTIQIGSYYNSALYLAQDYRLIEKKQMELKARLEI